MSIVGCVSGGLFHFFRFPSGLRQVSSDRTTGGANGGCGLSKRIGEPARRNLQCKEEGIQKGKYLGSIEEQWNYE